MKKELMILMLGVIFLATACNQSQSIETMYIQRAKESKNTELPIIDEQELDAVPLDDRFLPTRENADVRTSGLKVEGAEICGMTALKKHLVLIDKKGSQLLYMDQKGKIRRRIGSPGSGSLEFQDPTAVTKDDRYLYILDSGNLRVQILDHRFAYVKELPIDMTDRDTGIRFDDIAVDKEQKVYISGEFITDPGIFVLDAETGKQSFQAVNFSGFLGEDETGCVYGLTAGQLFLPKSDRISFGIASGKCSLLACTPEDSRKKCDLQGMNSMSDFLIRDHAVYCVNPGYSELQKFSMDGTYLESLGEIDRDTEIQYVCEDEKGRLYVSGGKEWIYSFCFDQAEALAAEAERK